MSSPVGWPRGKRPTWSPSSATGCPPRRSWPRSGCRTRRPRACTAGAARDSAPLRGGRSELGVFLRPLTARRRAHPGGDLLSVLCVERTDEAVTGLVGTLLGAAGETTTRALASFLANLLDHPRQLAVLRDRPDRTADAWAESLRRDPPLHIVRRRAVEPVGAIPAGATVACLLGAAGRDPERFTDPDRYDAFRPDPAPSPTARAVMPPPRPSSPVSRPNTACGRCWSPCRACAAQRAPRRRLRTLSGARPRSSGSAPASRSRQPAPAAPRATTRERPPRVRAP